MSTKLAGKKELIDAIVPKNFGVGCRRPTVSFLICFVQDLRMAIDVEIDSLVMDFSKP